MKYSVLIHELALIELKEAVYYYESLDTSLGVKLLNEFNELVILLEQRPLIYQAKFKQYRQVQLKKFPYYVVYRIEDGIIAIYRFFHTKRDPNKKYKK